MLDNKDKLISLVGENTYNYVIDAITGKTTNVVDPNRYANSTSISQSLTFDVYLSDIDEILYEMRKMAKQIQRRLVDLKSSCKTIGITLRDSDFKTINRSKSLDSYTNDLYDINNTIADLLEENFIEKPYRLVGVFVSNIISHEDIVEEYNLFTINDKSLKLETINNMISSFQEKYGKHSLFRKKDENK
jgi:DNA polymerase-4